MWCGELITNHPPPTNKPPNQTTKHNGEPAKFKVTVLSQHKDPMSRVIQEAMNIKNHQDKGLECLNSKAEYRQAPIVRTKKNVIIGL